MAYDCGYNVIHVLTFDYDQRHQKEIQCVKKQCSDLFHKASQENKDLQIDHHIIDVKFIKKIAPVSSLVNFEIDNPDYDEMKSDQRPVSYVPFRNLMFLSICCSFAEAQICDKIWYGPAKADFNGYWDCRPAFQDQLNALLSLNEQNRIEIEAPLVYMSKADIIKKGVSLGVNYGNTWTCYSGGNAEGLADASTPSSRERINGFIEAGYKDPIQYIQQDAIDVLYENNNCIDIVY